MMQVKKMIVYCVFHSVHSQLMAAVSQILCCERWGLCELWCPVAVLVNGDGLADGYLLGHGSTNIT